MAGTRTIKGTLDRLQVSGGTEIAYLGPTKANNPGDLIRGFRVTTGSAGNIIVKIDKSSALLDIKIFQEDSFSAGTAPAGYYKYFNIAKAGKGKGVIAVSAAATTAYVVLMTFDDYSEASYVGSVVVP